MTNHLLAGHQSGLPISQAGDLAPTCIYATPNLDGLMVLCTDYQAAVVSLCLNFLGSGGVDSRQQLLAYAAQLVQGRTRHFHLPLYASSPNDSEPTLF